MTLSGVFWHSALKCSAMETFAEILPHAFEHAFIDTLKLVPFLFVTYLAMEALEHYASSKSIAAVRRAGTAGPIIGALLGVVPQCGFSAAAATLYSARVITLGTLFAVFLSTSDEMLPIMIAAQAPVEFIVEVLAIKALCGLIAGFAIDAVLRLRHHAVEAMRIHDLCERDHCGCDDESDAPSALSDTRQEHGEGAADRTDDSDGGLSRGEEREAELACASGERPDHGHDHAREHEHEHAHDHAHDHAHAHDHSHGHAHGFGAIAKSSLVHALQVTLFIFLVSLALEIVIDGVGEDALASFISANSNLSVVVSAIVGLIPNCAASVVLTELYLEGALSTGAMLAGLLVSAGVGLLVLFRANRPMHENFLIVAGLVACGVVFGFIAGVFGVAL